MKLSFPQSLISKAPTHSKHITRDSSQTKTQDLKNAKMAGQCVGKEDWPELLGAEGTVAKETIERENSTVKAEIVLEGTIVPADLVRVCDRVRVWVDTCGIVTRVPTIG